MGCSCVAMRDGTCVVSPYCRVHFGLTDSEHGEFYDPRAVIPPPSVPCGACVHDPMILDGRHVEVAAGTTSAPMPVAVCRRCRCVYLLGAA